MDVDEFISQLFRRGAIWDKRLKPHANRVCTGSRYASPLLSISVLLTAMLFGLLFIVFHLPSTGWAYENLEFLANVTRTLDGLLSETYDKRIRPDIGGPPVKVRINMLVKSLGPVSENEELFMMDVYLRQAWYDRRLGFSVPGKEEFSMSWLFLEKIWKPDTFFLNGKRSHLHKMTSPNKFVRLRKDGFLMYSSRLTISARCKMYLRKFPLDSQICALVIGSYGYTANDVLYEWDEKGVGLEEGISDAQYEIMNVTTMNDLTYDRGIEKYSVVSAHFFFRRSIGYYILQIYVPCTLIVFSSWISFWITAGDAAGRISLGATTVLSITTLGFGGRAQLPKVSYATALDWFVIICFAFTFCVLIEYACINVMNKIAADIKKVLEEKEKAAKIAAEKEAQESAMEKGLEGDDDLEHIDADGSEVETKKKQYVFLPHRWYSVPSDLSNQTLRIDRPWTPAASAVLTRSGSRSPIQSWYRHVILVLVKFWKGIHILPRQLEPDRESHRIDIVARRAFPLAFTFLVFTYAMLYSYYITDMHEQLDVTKVTL